MSAARPLRAAAPALASGPSSSTSRAPAPRTIPAEVLARANTLRGETPPRPWRAIGLALGWSKSGLHKAVRAARAASARPPEERRGDAARARRLRATFDRALRVADAAVAQVAKRVRAGEATAAEARALAGVAEAAMRMRLALAPPSRRGRP